MRGGTVAGNKKAHQTEELEQHLCSLVADHWPRRMESQPEPCQGLFHVRFIYIYYHGFLVCTQALDGREGIREAAGLLSTFFSPNTGLAPVPLGTGRGWFPKFWVLPEAL